MKELWEQYKGLIKIGIVLSVIALLVGAVEIISAFQYNNRQKNASSVISMEEYTEEFKAYDVTGLEQEEIDEALEKQRELEENKED